MKEYQFAFMVLMSLMSISLVVLLPSHVKYDKVANRSRWLMAGGMAVLAVQFLIQYIFDFRSSNIVLAVFTNLALLIPASALLSWSVLYLEQQGHLRRREWLVWVMAWIVVMGLLVFSLLTEWESIGDAVNRLKKAEIVATIIYGVVMFYYIILTFRQLEKIEITLANYYDREQNGLLWWIKLSVILFSLVALSVPILIFSKVWILRILSMSILVCIFMLWFCFVVFIITGATKKIREAEQSAGEEEKENSEKVAKSHELSEEVKNHVSQAVEQWMAVKGHLHAGITSPVAAKEMQIPRYLLTAWVKASGHTSFTQWITLLRIEEAKRMLREHKEWSVEAVADQCGISRSHFQRIFRRHTGLTPMEYQAGLD